jgi:hypothetical protein
LSPAAVVTHDDLGRYALEFLTGAPTCGLPAGAAYLAFIREKALSRETSEPLRAVLRVVEGAA